jgi:hypothetical protein
MSTAKTGEELSATSSALALSAKTSALGRPTTAGAVGSSSSADAASSASSPSWSGTSALESPSSRVEMTAAAAVAAASACAASRAIRAAASVAARPLSGRLVLEPGAAVVVVNAGGGTGSATPDEVSAVGALSDAGGSADEPATGVDVELELEPADERVALSAPGAAAAVDRLDRRALAPVVVPAVPARVDRTESVTESAVSLALPASMSSSSSPSSAGRDDRREAVVDLDPRRARVAIDVDDPPAGIGPGTGGTSADWTGAASIGGGQDPS